MLRDRGVDRRRQDGHDQVDEPDDVATAAIALVEHRWAIGLREAIRKAGRFHSADAWILPAEPAAIRVVLAGEEAETL